MCSCMPLQYQKEKVRQIFQNNQKKPKMARRAAFWAFFASHSNFFIILRHVIMVHHGTGYDIEQNHPKIAERGQKCPKSGSMTHFWLFFGYFEKFSALFPSDIGVAYMKT